MRKFETLVPPPELCKQIPEGQFKDSALVWHMLECTGTQYLLVREQIEWGINPAEMVPAPTLEEILVAIASSFDARITCEHHFGLWKVDYSYYPQAEFAVDEDNPVIAALRVWLELERKKHEQHG